ncbi:MAG: helix-turn-helix domain-containing protein, partial [Pseudomonadota bacterium]
VSAESLSLLLERQRKRLRLATEHAVDLGKKTPPERLAAFIIELAKAQAEQAGRRNAAAARVRVPISRGDIGDYLGLKSETVSRAIRSLEREGLISLPTLTTIVVNDRSAIEALAGGGRPRKSRSATA